MSFLMVGIGGGAGALLRYCVILFTTRVLGVLPFFATLGINVLGCFLMGICAEAVLAKPTIPDHVKALVTTGILGGFTTFSAFSFDTGRLINDGAPLTAAIYVFASVGGGIAAFFIGLALARAG